MFNNISNKRKLILLALGSILLIVLMYNMAVGRTLERRQLCKELEKKMAQSDELPQKIQSLEQELIRLESIIGSDGDGPIDVRQSLLEKITRYCNNTGIHMTELPQSSSKQQNGYLIQTNLIILQGGFMPLVKLIHKLEQQWKIARVVSVDFYLKRNRRNKTQYLQLDIYIQSIKAL